MAGQTKGFIINVHCHGRYQWTGNCNSQVFGYAGSLSTNQKRTPQEVLRDIADQIDRAAIQQLFAPYADPD